MVQYHLEPNKQIPVWVGRQHMLKEAESKWGVVSTRPRRERLASAQLSNQGIEVFLPQLKKTVSRRGRQVVERAPLFTGYLFLAVGRDVARWRSINGTVGVKRLLMQNEQPALVPDEFIEMLRLNCNQDGILAYHRWLSPGDTAAIVAGPLSNRIGKLLSIDAKGRVELLVEMLSSTVPVKMNGDNLMPAQCREGETRGCVCRNAGASFDRISAAGCRRSR